MHSPDQQNDMDADSQTIVTTSVQRRKSVGSSILKPFKARYCITGDRKVPSQPAPASERGRFTHGTCPGRVSGRTTWLVLPLVVSSSSGPTCVPAVTS